MDTVCKYNAFAFALRMSKVDPALAKTEAESAVAAGILSTNADDAFIKVTANSPNPLGGITAWNEFRMSAAMESTLKGYKDPRMSKYFAPVSGTSDQFKGLRNGYSQAELGLAENGPNANSNVANAFLPDNMYTTSYGVMFASEAHFLKAEGALNGWNMGAGTAKEFYENGITTADDAMGNYRCRCITAYINGTSTPIALSDKVKTPALTNIPVKWASTAAKQREQILTQKWLALFPYGFEAWAEYRRSGFPKLYPRLNTDDPEVPVGTIVRRAPFVAGEISTNKAGVESGVSKLGGADKSTTRLWWDKP